MQIFNQAQLFRSLIGFRLTMLICFAALATLSLQVSAQQPSQIPESTSPVRVRRVIANVPTINSFQTVTGGEPVIIMLVLDNQAPRGGLPLKFSKSIRDSGPITTLDEEITVTVPAGAASVDVKVETLPTQTLVTQTLSARSEVVQLRPDGTRRTVFGFAVLRLNVAPRAIDDPRGQPINYEAELATLTNAVVDNSNNSLFTGSGYVDFLNANGAAEFQVQAAQTRSHLLIFRYAYQGFDFRQVDVVVNGQRQRFTFRPTPGVQWYVLQALQVDLQAGINTVRVEAIDDKAPNIDALIVAAPSEAAAPVVSPVPPAPPAPFTLEAEEQEVIGGRVESINSGFTGSGYVVYQNLSNDRVRFLFNLPVGRTYNLTFRYALEAGTRELDLFVNGSRQTLTFSATGSATEWRTISVPVSLNPGANAVWLLSSGQGGPNFDSLNVAAQ